VFEVTQPRVTCYRVGIRMSEPRVAALLVSHRRPGFYCRCSTRDVCRPARTLSKWAPGPKT
jgi:MOSC domain-containing protein YiiM